MVGNKILVKKKDPPVVNFGMVRNKILVKKKDPPICREFWHGQEQNSGEKERPSYMS